MFSWSSSLPSCVLVSLSLCRLAILLLKGTMIRPTLSWPSSSWPSVSRPSRYWPSRSWPSRYWPSRYWPSESWPPLSWGGVRLLSPSYPMHICVRMLSPTLWPRCIIGALLSHAQRCAHCKVIAWAMSHDISPWFNCSMQCPFKNKNIQISYCTYSNWHFL